MRIHHKFLELRDFLNNRFSQEITTYIYYDSDKNDIIIIVNEFKKWEELREYDKYTDGQLCSHLIEVLRIQTQKLKDVNVRLMRWSNNMIIFDTIYNL